MIFTLHTATGRYGSYYCLEQLKNSLDRITNSGYASPYIYVNTYRPKYLGPALAKIFNVTFTKTSFGDCFSELEKLPSLTTIAMLRLYRSYIKFCLRQPTVEAGIDSIIENILLKNIRSISYSGNYISVNREEALMLVYLYKSKELDLVFKGSNGFNGIFSAISSFVNVDVRKQYIKEMIKKYFGENIESKKYDYNTHTLIPQIIPVDSLSIYF